MSSSAQRHNGSSPILELEYNDKAGQTGHFNLEQFMLFVYPLIQTLSFLHSQPIVSSFDVLLCCRCQESTT